MDGSRVLKLQQLIDRTAKYTDMLRSESLAGQAKAAYETQPGAPDAAQSRAPQQKKKAGPAAPQAGGDLAGKLTTLQESKDEFRGINQPPTVTGGKLRSYQLEALNWLAAHFENGINAILADEMGLGKTITTISLIGHLWHMGVRGPFLVVAPVSTLSNWTGEFEHWAPTLPVLLYHGSPEEREHLRGTLLQMTKRPPPRAAIKLSAKKRRKTVSGEVAQEELSEALSEAVKNKQLPIVITSYEIAIRDIRFLRQHSWKYLVVDEAHRLKNFECRLICELRSLKTSSRLLLTGTPLQNNLTELWSLLNFLLPDIFSNVGDFKQWFDFTSILETQTGNSAESDAQQLHADIVAKLHSLMRPFLLRRLKQDVEVGLPKKQEVVVYASTTPTQRSLYDAIKDRTLKLRAVSLNNLVMQLRKVCNHPFLFDDDVIKRVFEAADDAASPEDGDAKAKEEQEKAEAALDSLSIAERLRSHSQSVSPKVPKYVEEDDSDDDALDDDEFEKRLLESCVVHSEAPEASAAPKAEPRRKKSAYNVFSSECWAQIRLEGRKINRDEFPHVASDIAQRWAALGAEERAVYEARLEEELRAQDDLLAKPSRVRTPEEIAQVSGKMGLLHRMLPELHRRGHRVLIFSQMTRVLDVLEEYVQQAGYSFCRIDGSVAQAERKQQIEEFSKQDVFVFLLSTRAGGQGINLMAADTVIIYDSDWNPQMDIQAMDRCHRIGQTKPVVVYRLITANTVDSKILHRAREKLMLERLVVGKGGFSRKNAGNTLTEEELRDMLRWRAGEGGERAVTEDELTRLLDRELVFRDAEAAAAPPAAAAAPAPAPGSALSPSPSQSVTPTPEAKPFQPPGFMFVTTTRGQL